MIIFVIYSLIHMNCQLHIPFAFTLRSSRPDGHKPRRANSLRHEAKVETNEVNTVTGVPTVSASFSVGFGPAMWYIAEMLPNIFYNNEVVLLSLAVDIR